LASVWISPWVHLPVGPQNGWFFCLSLSFSHHWPTPPVCFPAWWRPVGPDHLFLIPRSWLTISPWPGFSSDSISSP
jgi:hypothetical protein